MKAIDRLERRVKYLNKRDKPLSEKQIKNLFSLCLDEDKIKIKLDCGLSYQKEVEIAGYKGCFPIGSQSSLSSTGPDIHVFFDRDLPSFPNIFSGGIKDFYGSDNILEVRLDRNEETKVLCLHSCYAIKISEWYSQEGWKQVFNRRK